MLRFIKRYGHVAASVLLLLPANIFVQFFAYFFESLTGLLMPGYVAGCLLFGFLAALPILRRISRSEKSRSIRIVFSLAVVLLFAGILFLTLLTPNF